MISVEERDALLSSLPRLVRDWLLFEAVANWSIKDILTIMNACHHDPDVTVAALRRFEKSLTLKAYGPGHPRSELDRTR